MTFNMQWGFKQDEDRCGLALTWVPRRCRFMHWRLWPWGFAFGMTI